MKQALKKQMKSMLAWVLAIAMTFANVEPVRAAVMVENVEEAVLEDVSANTVSSNAVMASEGDVTGNDVIVSDTWQGMTWTLTSEGALTISGNYVFESATMVPWLEDNYKDIITKAVVTAQNVGDIHGWFQGCINLQNVDFSNFSANQTENMNSLFRGCSSLTELDLSGFDTSSVTDMKYMFEGCSSLTELDLSSFDTSHVTDMVHMFEGCSSLETVDLSSFDTSNVTNMAYMFGGCSSLQRLDLKSFRTNKVVSMQCMFYDCSRLTELSFSEFGASNVTSMNSMFRNCKALLKLDLQSFNTSNVTDMEYMFEGCNNLQELNVSSFDTSNVLEMSYMFDGCYELTELDVSGFDTRYSQNMVRMFGDCRSLKKLDVSNFNTRSVTHMIAMFAGCSSLTELDVSNFDTSNVTLMTGMFHSCSSLTELDVSNFDVSRASMDDMFYYCTGLERVKCFPNLYDKEELPHNVMYDIAGNSYETYFPRELEYGIWLYKENPNTGDNLRVTEVAPQIYTGKPVKPQIQVYFGDTLLQEKVDYTLSYKNNTKVNDASVEKNAPTIIVKGKGNFNKQDTVTFEILAKDLNDSDVKVTDIVKLKNNKVQKPVPTLTYNGKKLVNKRDFTVSYPDMSEENSNAYRAPGTYRILVAGKGNFTGEKEILFTIVDGVLMSTVKIGSIKSQPYTGEKIEPAVKVTYKGKELTPVTDYEVSYDRNEEVGTATVTITGKGTYIGTKTATFKIIGQSIAKAKVNGISNTTYDGTEKTFDISVMLGEVLLEKDKHYEVSYTDNVNAGTATVTITGKGNYTGTVKKKFKIDPLDFANAESSTCVSTDEVTHLKGGAQIPFYDFRINGVLLEEGKDYTLSYTNNKKVATATDKKMPTLTVKGKGNYKGTLVQHYTIKAKNLQDIYGPITMNAADVGYSKSKGKYKSKPVLIDSDGKTLVAGMDYEKNPVYTLADGTVLDNKSVVEEGQVITVTVQGKGNYEGPLSTTYTVRPGSINSAKVKITPQVYTGKEITLYNGVFEYVMIGKDKLDFGEDYEIVSYANNLKKGTARVTIRGVGNYGGTKTVKFKIVPKELIWFWRLFS